MNASTDLNTLLNEFKGSECYYWHSPTKLAYTEGVQYLAERFGCHWLVDKILIEASLNKNLAKEQFQIWTLIRQEQGFMLACGDGNGRVLFSEFNWLLGFCRRQGHTMAGGRGLAFSSGY